MAPRADWLTCAVLLACGFAPARAQLWEVGNIGLEPGLQADDRAGQAVALGDFDGDGYDDLAFGVPGWDSAAATDAGKVCFLFGTPERVLEPAAGGVPTPICVEGSGETTSELGWSLAAGDVDGDGRAEVAVGLPEAEVTVGPAQVSGAGAVWIFEHTGATGDHSFDPSPIELTLSFHQGSLGPFSAPELDDRFGYVLTVGDFDGDTFADLAIGTPYESAPGLVYSGAVQVVYGGASGLDVSDSQGFQSGPQDFDRLGWALAAGDFDGDGYDDLAAGMPWEDFQGVVGTGVVYVYSGSPTGLAYQLFLAQTGFPGQDGDTNARFGWALAAGNFDGACPPCRDDLAIGVPVAIDGTASDAGAVWIAWGTELGPEATFGQRLNATSAGFSVEEYSYFGSAIVAGPIDRPTDGNASDDMVVGAPATGLPNLGTAGVLFGGAGSIDETRSQPLPLKPGFALAPPVSQDAWGSVFALGDLDGDGWGDLVVGVPDRAEGASDEVGAIQVLYGALFADGFGRQSTGGWPTAVP